MDYLNFLDFLSNIKRHQLPGFESHKKMVPFRLNPNIRDFTPKSDSKESAVLIIFNKNQDNNIDLIFTLRSSKLKKHSGQISFPGGRKEKNETNIETALRETHEEIGVDSSNFSIIKEISQLYVPPSNSVVYPIVSYTDNKLDFELNEDEVEELIIKDFKHFLNNDNLKYSTSLYKNQTEKFPFWDINHHTPLWGATAIILQELIDLYNIYKKSGS